MYEHIARFQKNGAEVAEVGDGFKRKLYATFISYLNPRDAVSDLTVNSDKRGDFSEVVKTVNSGQVCYFTCKPGYERGRHYHNTKVEKFLVLAGNALFKFRNVETGKNFEIEVAGTKPQIVMSIPGWAHSITNTGDEDLICMLWISEKFNPQDPDTYLAKLYESSYNSWNKARVDPAFTHHCAAR